MMQCVARKSHKICDICLAEKVVFQHAFNMSMADAFLIFSGKIKSIPQSMA